MGQTPWCESIAETIAAVSQERGIRLRVPRPAGRACPSGTRRWGAGLKAPRVFGGGVVVRLALLVTDQKTVTPPFPSDFLLALADRPIPTRLRKRTFEHALLSGEALDQFGRSANFPDLQGIWFRDCRFSDDSLVPLANIALPSLRSVGLTGFAARGDLSVLVNRFGEDGVLTQYRRSYGDLENDL